MGEEDLGTDEAEAWLNLNHSNPLNDSTSHPLSGISSTPSILRRLFFPKSSVPSSPAVDSTLSQLPFSRPPPHVTDNPVFLSTLAARPDLFAVSTPIKSNLLGKWLRNHPNRPLVASVLVGLDEGFWPSHDGNFEKYHAEPLPKHSPEDDAFLLDSARKDFDLGFMSNFFDTLLPGMLISPSHVVRPENRKARQVCDQTSNGLNDGIDRSLARTIYDTILHLGTLMRFRRRRGEDFDPITRLFFGILWKSDVSKAFRRLPVSIFWQLKQIHRLRMIDKNGKVKTVYMVDQRLILGGRMAPIIWCTVLNLILWGTRYHLYLEFPFAFVDDVFGYDTSRLLLSITHPITRESRLVPREQALVLTSWNQLGVPWDWEKQEHSAGVLTILGHDIDAVNFTVTLPPSSKAAFIAYIRNFLDRPHKSPRKLIEWQKLAGYGQWVCTSLPFAKFALQALYDKMKGKSFRNAPISLNNLVRQSLEWLASQIAIAPPLYLLDPALEDWAESEANLVIRTDACLKADGTGKPGLGCWWVDPRTGCPQHFFHRSTTPSDDIAATEALAILSALDLAISSRLPLRRILVLTDSALSVYAFDSGRASPTLHSIVWTAYRLLDDSRVDLRVRHIIGDDNSVADSLSRKPLSYLQNFPNLYSFNPPTHLIILLVTKLWPSSLSPPSLSLDAILHLLSPLSNLEQISSSTIISNLALFALIEPLSNTGRHSFPSTLSPGFPQSIPFVSLSPSSVNVAKVSTLSSPVSPGTSTNECLIGD